MTKLVYRSFNDGRWFLITKGSGKEPWYRGYVTIDKQDAKKIHVGDCIDCIGEAKDVGLADILNPYQLVAGVDTADPGEQGMAIATAITRLELIAGTLDNRWKNRH